MSTRTESPFRRSWVGFLPSVVLVALVLFPRGWLPFSPTQALAAPGMPPDSIHWFGTDRAGMDVFSRTVASFQIDVTVGLLVAAVAVVLAALIGVGIGVFESEGGLAGKLARLVGRCVDLFQSIPVMATALVVVVSVGVSVPTMVIGLGLVLAPAQIRLVRTEVLRVRGLGYVDAAVVAGYPRWRVAVSRVLPNSTWPLVENFPLIFATGIMILAALGFLGVGLPPPSPEWGVMISQGASDAAVGRWWTAVFPALALVATVLAVLTTRDVVMRRLAERTARPRTTTATG
ncbi:hypothetical protein BH10ACT9_BH10ACT9_17290 [soil metagenome]